MANDPFNGGTGSRGRGRPSALSDPEFQQAVAEAFVGGMTRPEMAEHFNVQLSTISRWRRDPRIKARALKLTEDRVLQITRKVDSEIERRLGNAKDMTTRELLETRKEFLGGAFRQQTEGVDDATTQAAMALLEKNPELAAQMMALLSGEGTVEPAKDATPTAA